MYLLYNSGFCGLFTFFFFFSHFKFLDTFILSTILIEILFLLKVSFHFIYYYLCVLVFICIMICHAVPGHPELDPVIDAVVYAANSGNFVLLKSIIIISPAFFPQKNLSLHTLYYFPCFFSFNSHSKHTYYFLFTV